MKAAVKPEVKPSITKTKPRTKTKPKPKLRSAPTGGRSRGVEATAVTVAELRALKQQIERRVKPRQSRAARQAPMRWNPDPDDVRKSVAQLVLTLVEFLRKLMERQAIRRMEERTLTKRQIDDVGKALMTLEQTIRDMAAQFGLTPEELNLDLGPLGKLM